MTMRITRYEKTVLQQIRREHPEKMNMIGRAAAEGIVGDIQLSMRPGTGQEYKRKGGQIHVASAPGQPPAPDTGELRASIRWEEESDLRFIVADGVEYGIYLEQGTPRMRPRPFMGPVFEAWRMYKFIDMIRRMGIV